MPIGEDAGSIWAYLGLDVSQFVAGINSVDKGVRQVEAAIASAGRTVAAFGRKLTMSVSLPLAALGAASVREFARFDKAMTESLAIMGNVSSEMRSEMEATAKTLATQGVHSATELARAYFFLASAGLDATESLKGLPIVAEFAQAGMMNLSSAADMLATSVSAMHGDIADADELMAKMTHTSDLLVKANTLTTATVKQLATALTNKAAAAARLANKDMTETVAVLAAFAKAGIKGQRAGRQMEIMLRDLQTASIKNADMFKRFGIEVFDAAGNMRHTALIVKDMENALGSMSTEQRRASLAMLGFQQRGISATLALVGLSKFITETDNTLKSAGGTAEEVAKKQMLALTNQLKAAWHEVQNLSIEIGSNLVPALKMGVGWVLKATRAFADLSSGTQKAIIVTAAFVAAIGPVVWIIGKIVVAMKVLGKALLIVGLAIKGGAVALVILATKAAVVIVVAVAFFKLGNAIAMVGAEIDKTGAHIDRFTVKNKAFVKSAEAMRKASRSARDAQKGLAALAGKEGSLEFERKRLQILKGQARATLERANLNRILKQEAIGRGDLAAAQNRNRLDIKRRAIISGILSDLKKQRTVVKDLEEAQKRLTQQSIRAEFVKQAKTQLQELLFGVDQGATQVGQRVRKLQKDMAKQIKEVSKIQERNQILPGGFAMDQQVFDTAKARVRAFFESEIALAREASRRRLDITVAAGRDRERLQLEQQRDVLLREHQTQFERLRILKWFNEQVQMIERQRVDNIDAFTMTSAQRRFQLLSRETDEMMMQTRNAKERAAVEEASLRKRSKLVKDLINREKSRIGRNVQLRRLTGLEVGTAEGFASEKGISDDMLRHLEDQLKTQMATEKVLQDMKRQGITIRNQKVATLRG